MMMASVSRAPFFFKIEVRGAQEGHGYGMLYDSSLLPNKAKVSLEV